LRIDLHVVKGKGGWHVERARATLAIAEEVDEAVAAAKADAKGYVGRGWTARVAVHRLGKAPEILTFEPKV
jgi:hypothetical protein